MTSTTASLPADSSRVLAAVGAVLSGFVIFAGNYNVQDGENGGLWPGIVTAVLCAILLAVLFGYVMPRVHNVDRAVLVLGVLSVVSLIAFWSGVPPVLAAATVGLRQREPSRRNTVLACVAGAAAALTVIVTAAQSNF
jgi:ABC-type branched-subunit amino acid transport system permease subunit